MKAPRTHSAFQAESGHSAAQAQTDSRVIHEEKDPKGAKKHAVGRRPQHHRAEPEMPQPVDAHGHVRPSTGRGGRGRCRSRRRVAISSEVTAERQGKRTWGAYAQRGMAPPARTTRRHTVSGLPCSSSSSSGVNNRSTTSGGRRAHFSRSPVQTHNQTNQKREETTVARSSSHVSGATTKQHRYTSPQDEKHHVREEPTVVASAHTVPYPRAVVVERPHAPAAVSAVPRSQGSLYRARVARRAGDGAGPALQPQQSSRRVLDV